MAQITKKDLDEHVKNMQEASAKYSSGKITILEAAELEAKELNRFRCLANKANSELSEDKRKARENLERGLEQRKLEATPDE